MMDKKTVLENGILEQFLLGELTPYEAAELQQLLDTDKALKAHFDELERDFEILGLENAVAPPIFVKDALMKGIKNSENEIPHVKSTINAPQKSNTQLYLGVAASFAALLLLSTLWLYNELETIKNQLQIVQEENNILEDDLNAVSKDLSETSKWYATIADPDTEQYVLNGNALMPNAKVVSYVNHKDKSVVINTKKLPKLNVDKDYQMWADVDGEMIDMGVISKNQELISMTYIDHAESLNITIEPAGGNDHPTVSQLISNVYLK